MLGTTSSGVYAVWIMGRRTQICTMLCLLIIAGGSATGLAVASWSELLLAAMPIYQPSMTRVDLTTAMNGGCLSIDRSITSSVLVGASISIADPFELHARLLAPIRVAPAFLAIDVSTRRISGLMTLFFGPVSIDLGRSWIELGRWAFVQLVVHPRLTLVLGGIWQSDSTIVQGGWRLFPTASAQWEVDLLFAGNEIRLAVAGVL